MAKMPKARHTPAGRERCDICHKAVYETQNCEEVNGRIRHWLCWPGYLKLNRERHACFSAIQADPARQLYALIDFNQKVQQLKDFEWLMKAVNCTSKAVRDELLRSNNPGLALAHKKA